MASLKQVRTGPIALTAVTTVNLVNPPIVSGGVGFSGSNVATYYIMRHLHVANKTNGALFFALWLGATGANAAGSEIIAAGAAAAGALTAGTGVSIPTNSYFDWYGALRLDIADFLVGGASAVGLTLNTEGDLGVL